MNNQIPMKTLRFTLAAFALAALAACGGAFLYLTDFEQWSVTQSSVPGMGFNGIAAAFLGGLNPIGTIFASYFIQHITVGGAFVDKTMYSSQISDLISSIIIYLCGFVGFFRYFFNTQLAKRSKDTANSNDVPINTAAPADDDKKGGAEK